MLQSFLIFPLLKNIAAIIAGIVGLNFLIGFHELGHFLFCKLFGIHTPSFSIGFGPALLKKEIGSTVFSLSAIPLGGYVEIAGLAEIGQGEQTHAHIDDASSFNAKPYYQKVLVMLGGILFNLIFAYAAFISLFYLGVPKTHLLSCNTPIPVIASVNHGSAAEKAGLQAGDRILQVNTIPIESSVEPIKQLLDASEGSPLSFQIQRNEKIMRLTLIPDAITTGEKQAWIMGAAYQVETPTISSFSEAFYRGIAEANRWIVQTARSFCACKKLTVVKEMAGPVMIVSMMMKAASESFTLFLTILAIISINLAVLNLIPLPILDGGQFLYFTIEALIGRPLSERIRMGIHIATWILFAFLFIFLTYQDISRLIGPLKAFFTQTNS